jgi:hypothetical protein
MSIDFLRDDEEDPYDKDVPKSSLLRADWFPRRKIWDATAYEMILETVASPTTKCLDVLDALGLQDVTSGRSLGRDRTAPLPQGRINP